MGLTYVDVIADAGGVPLADARRMREGAVYRISGGLIRSDDFAELDAAGLQTVVDLRGADEDRSVVEDWARANGVGYVNHPITAAGHSATLLQAIRQALETGTEAEYIRRTYQAIVDDHGVAIAGTIGALADGLPAGFGCAAGKDRTGVVNACLQVLLGASEEDATDFYATNAPSPERLRPVAREFLGLADSEQLPSGMELIMGVERSTMLDVFDRIRERWGGVEQYLEEHGLGADQAETLRERLVVPA